MRLPKKRESPRSVQLRPCEERKCEVPPAYDDAGADGAFGGAEIAGVVWPCARSLPCCDIVMYAPPVSSDVPRPGG